MGAFYAEELGRLGRFLVACGGTPPSDALAETTLRYDLGEGNPPLAGREKCRPAPMPGRRRAFRGDAQL